MYGKSQRRLFQNTVAAAAKSAGNAPVEKKVNLVSLMNRATMGDCGSFTSMRRGAGALVRSHTDDLSA